MTYAAGLFSMPFSCTFYSVKCVAYGFSFYAMNVILLVKVKSNEISLKLTFS